MKVIIKNTIKNAKGKVIATKGEVMSEAKAIKKGVRPCYYEVITSAVAGVLYTKEEDTRLVSLYLELDGAINVVVDRFLAENNTHSRSSVYQLVSGLRTLDTHYPNDTQWVVKSHLEAVATSISPHRFS